MVGGVVLKTASQTGYLIRQAAKDKTKNKLDFNLSDIKTGRAEDVRLKNGDVIFISRGCVDEKLLPPTKPSIPFPISIPSGVDSPIHYEKEYQKTISKMK